MYAVSQDSMWVLVTADVRVTPILAYSDAKQECFLRKKICLMESRCGR